MAKQPKVKVKVFTLHIMSTSSFNIQLLSFYIYSKPTAATACINL